MVLDGTTWIGGDINKNKKEFMGLVTKNRRMDVRERYKVQGELARAMAQLLKSHKNSKNTIS